MKKYLLLFIPFALFCGQVKLCVSLKIDDQKWDLARCLNSIAPIVDCISIYDCGQTSRADETIFVLEELVASLDVPVAYFPAESEELRCEAARELVQKLSFPLEETYVLFLDPNAMVQVGSAFIKDAMEAPSYLLLEQSASFSCFHHSLRLVRADVLEEFAPFLLDQIPFQAPSFCPKLRTLMIETQTSPEKMVEELSICLAKYERDSTDGHLVLLLAHLQKTSKDFTQAIESYQQRIELGGDREEVWLSKYKIGECHQEMGEWESAFQWYLDAYQEDPQRAEPLLKIATHYREVGKNEIAYLFAKHGSKIPPAESTNLLPFLCHYQFDEELSVTAYYTRFREEGFQAASDLLLRRGVPDTVRDTTYRNLLFYVSKLKNVRYTPIQFDLPLISPEGDERYHPMNPSITKSKEGYQVVCRGVNYTQKGAKYFHTSDPQGVFRSLNYLLTYDRDFRLLSQYEVCENLERERIPKFLIEGMEDCRIFEYGKSLWFTCTCFDTNPTGNLQISLCKLRDRPVKKEIEVEKMIPLIGPDPYRCEKNWVPFVHDGQIHIIYSYDPFIVYQPNLRTGECEEIVHYRPSHAFSRFRGSAAPIAFDSGYLSMVHEVVFLPEFERAYLHRFLYLDRNFRVQSVSKPFIFTHWGVEFCNAMTIDHSGKDLVLAIGSEDKEAWLASVDLDTIRSLLEPLPSTMNPPFFID